MRFLTVEVEIDHGRISLGGGEALPDKAIGLFTILSPEVMDSEFKTNELQLSQALASGLLTFLTSCGGFACGCHPLVRRLGNCPNWR